MEFFKRVDEEILSTRSHIQVDYESIRETNMKYMIINEENLIQIRIN